MIRIYQHSFICITIIVLFITFMQGIYNYIPETNHVSRVYSAVAVQYLQFVLHVTLFCPWNMFCTFTLAPSVVCVQCPIWLFFCSFLISCFSDMLLIYCWSDLEVVPVAPVITGITFAFTHHMRWISVMRSLYFRILSASFLITFLSPGIQIPVNMHVPFYYHIVLLSFLSPLCRVFTTIYLKQAIFLGHIVLQLFCIYSLCHM